MIRKVCFIGANQAGIIGLLTTLSKGCEIPVAVSYSNDLTMVLKAHKIPVYKTIKVEKFVEELKSADLLLSVHGREIVPEDLLSLTKFGGINVHPYLYNYKGADPVKRALEDQEFNASVGAHVMTRGIDEGKVILEEYLNVEPAVSEVEIYNKLYPLYALVISKLLDGGHDVF